MRSEAIIPTNWLKAAKRAVAPILRHGNEIDAILDAAPPLAQRIYLQLEKSLCRAYNLREGDTTATKLGTMAGVLDSCSKIDFQSLAKTKVHSRDLTHALKALPSVMEPVQKIQGTMSQKFGRIMSKQPPLTQIEFLNAYQRAIEKKIFPDKEPAVWETTSTRIYIALFFLIPVMPKIRSVSHLHQILSRIPGVGAVGRLNDVKQSKRLGKMCQRIGLKFRTRGRPTNFVPAPVTA